ncbi:hypothetical protein E3Q18_01731 [Wallemia mellicola]|nr:hypothetical protein E3Q19_03960 [Wallemia mellicola]TIB99181.1 hypothetical protein E3Q18_01731 [Wallemia mellicola]TIC29353.1 hypothetical protein E3Q11_01398 [Wallemia mellicola]
MSRIFSRTISHSIRRRQQDWWFVEQPITSTSTATATTASSPPSELPESLRELHNYLNTLPYLNKSSITWKHIDEFQRESDELINNEVSSALNPWIWAGKVSLLEGIGKRGVERTFKDLRSYFKMRSEIARMYGLEPPERRKYARKGLSNLRKSQGDLIKDKGSWGLIEHFDSKTGVSAVIGVWEKESEVDDWGVFEE